MLAACQNYGQPKSVADASEAIPDKVDYNWDVRPILSQNCFQCHGNDGKNRKASLRLDLADAAYGKLPENPGKRAIVPGNPKKSELFKRITSTDPDYRMPPKEAHKTVSARDIAVLERWIKQGAKYKPHWAYIPVKEVKPRRTEWDKQAVNPIDRYVFAKLKASGLAPSAEADRETLINRVTLDLTGLPPTLAEVDAFVADKSPNAYEKLVDRLIASTAYAERQAETWLDVARYADSDGYLNDGDGRFQHPYRDWVISAFKRNLPYDRFVTWQIAGDKLPNPTREQILATAFARAGKKSNEGGIIDEEYRVEYVNERAELIGKAFLGLTVGCAKCHDHKYDIISQADYYSMGGFFNSVAERGIHSGGGRSTPMGPTLAWPTPTQAKNLAKAQAVTAAKRQAFEQALAASVRRAAAVVAAVPAAGRGDVVRQAIESSTQAYLPLDSGYKASFESLMIGGPRPPRRGLQQASMAKDPDEPRVAGQELDKALRDAVKNGLKLESSTAILKRQLPVGLKAETLQWTPSGLPGGKPGTLSNVTFVDGARGKAVMLKDSAGFVDKSLGQFERTQPFSLDLWVKLRAGKPYNDVPVLYNQDGARGGGYQLILDGNLLTFELGHLPPYNLIGVKTTKPLPAGRWVHLTATYDGGSRARGLKLYVDGRPAETVVQQDHLTRTTVVRGGDSQLGSYYGLQFGRNTQRLEMIGGAIDEFRVLTRALTPTEVAYLQNPNSVRTLEQKAVLADMALSAAAADPAVQAARAALDQAVKAEQAIETPIYQVMVLADAPVVRPTHVLDRGLYDQPRQETPVQALPRVFRYDAKKYAPNRLGLASWLFDPKHPLTARVYVNRLWQGHFGAGIVQTVEDFGTQGANPTHPELLDYLAIEFVRSGWDIRHMHKLMVMSATYRQVSTITPDRLEKDPRNFLLARGPRYRMSAELIRDNALFASGLLVNATGGDSVFPYQPEGVWDGAGVGVAIYPTDVPRDQMHRRTMYTFMKRNAPFPSLAVFDMPDRTGSTVERKISNTPLQALVLLNDPQFMEAYRKLAEKVIRQNPDPESRIRQMFRLGLRRAPTAGEAAILRDYLTAQLAEMSASPAKAEKLLKIGATPADAALSPAEVAAMTMVTAAVLNSPDAYSLR